MIQAWTPERAFNELPLLPPPIDIESKAVLKSCVRAATALAALDRAAELIPNPQILINTLPILEAQTSSEIENIVTTTDELFEHLRDDGSANAATKEALRYRHALMEAYAGLPQLPLASRLAESICSRIKGTTMSVRTVPGTAIANASTGQIVYTPPDGETGLRNLLENWEQFVHAGDDLEPLVRLAVAHYQFEAIHPFLDGNGRTGRVLNSLFLVERELLHLPILYLSRFIIQHKSEYYRLLLSVTSDSEWEPWILYMLRGIEETARWTLAKVDAMRTLMEETRAVIRAERKKIYSQELLDTIFEQPYCRISNLAEKGLAKRQAASRYLKALAEIGVLEEQARGREKLWINRRLLRLLTSASV